MEYQLEFNVPKNISVQSSYWERKIHVSVRAQLKTIVEDQS